MNHLKQLYYLMYNTIMNEIVKCVLYARVSSDRQGNEDHFSIPAQLVCRLGIPAQQ